MLKNLHRQPDDPIIELAMLAKADPSPNVVDLSVGVYKDPEGHTSIMEAVRQAEPRRLQKEETREPIRALLVTLVSMKPLGI